MRTLKISTMIVLVLVTWAPATGGQPTQTPGQASSDAEDRRQLIELARRIDDYVQMHRHLEGSTPTLEVSTDPAEVRKAIAALGRKVRQARKTARQGDVFTPASAAILRRLIAEGCAGNFDGLRAIINDENPAATDMRPEVNATYPAGAGFSMIPPGVLCALPALPDELQYRFMDRYLILWDWHANLIVDYVPDAFPGSDRPRTRE